MKIFLLFFICMGVHFSFGKEKAEEMDSTEMDTTEAGGLSCSDCAQPVLGDNMTDICLALIKSPVCKDVPKEKQIQCNATEGSPMGDVGNYIWGCLKFTIGETLSAIWDLLKFAWAHTDSTVREETAHQASQAMDSVKLYLSTEYEKAYEEAGPPKAVRAAMAVAGSLGVLLYNSIVDKFAKDIQEWPCFNQQAKAGKVCEYILYLAGGSYGATKIVKILLDHKNAKKVEAQIANWYRLRREVKVELNANAKLADWEAKKSEAQIADWEAQIAEREARALVSGRLEAKKI